jgi:predicted secreted acid phosphatase
MIKISSFNDVKIEKNNSLILCDIDNTILYYPDCEKRCLEIIKEICPDENSKEFKEEFRICCNKYKYITDPTHTDYNGFMNLLNKIKESNSKLLFLTARNKENYHNKTIKHLSHIGVPFDENDIHYTNATITKGEYIKKYIDIHKWNQIIFIDDYESYIKTVTDLFPQIISYNFHIKS